MIVSVCAAEKEPTVNQYKLSQAWLTVIFMFMFKVLLLFSSASQGFCLHLVKVFELGGLEMCWSLTGMHLLEGRKS